ncbi:hypothetical protein E2C01_053759 [Portunus trituberculatus]|uniref:Uncharacterized protein n=1 Tax=Portunus trituberculatus TaxID=210409 RepID=A0A5B7GL71_PORTR|nr:hypothetical protein [Portunus trituberculatus]
MLLMMRTPGCWRRLGLAWRGGVACKDGGQKGRGVGVSGCRGVAILMSAVRERCKAGERCGGGKILVRTHSVEAQEGVITCSAARLGAEVAARG